MRIAVDSIMIPGRSGGVEQATRRLVASLLEIASPEHEVIVFVHEFASDWYQDAASLGHKIVAVAQSDLDPALHGSRDEEEPVPTDDRSRLRRGLSRLKSHLVPASTYGIGSMRRPTRLMESFGPDVFFYPMTVEISENVPSVVTVHDLQHRHFPEFFNRFSMWRRDTVWPETCRRAGAVVAISGATRSDLMEQYGIPGEKIHVVHYGGEVPSRLDEAVAKTIVDKQGILTPFALYPARTWEHKNHLRLLETVAHLREQGIEITVVCPGVKTDHWPVIAREVERLGLEGAVVFPGFVDVDVLAAFFQRARMVVFPSLFEGAGLPLLEAFSWRVPVACSNVTSLPEYGGDAALYFEPHSVRSMTDALARLWNDDDLRESLVRNGTARLNELSWEKAAVQVLDLLKGCVA